MLNFRNVISRSDSFDATNAGDVQVRVEVADVTCGGISSQKGLIQLEGEVREGPHKWREKFEIQISPDLSASFRKGLTSLDHYLDQGAARGVIEKEAYFDVSDEVRIGHVYTHHDRSYYCYARFTKGGRSIEARFENIRGLWSISNELPR